MDRFIYFIVFLLSVVVPRNANAQTFSIAGNITDLPDHAIVRLFDAEKNAVIDTAVVHDRQFQLKGHFDYAPKSVVMQIQGANLNEMGYLFIGNENITITGKSVDFPSRLVISGSASQQEKLKLDALLRPLEEKQKGIGQQLKKMYEAGQMNDSIQNAYLGQNGIMSRIEDEKRNVEKCYIEENPNSYYSLYLLNLYKSNYYTDAALKSVFKKLKGKFKKTKEYKAIAIQLQQPKPKKGDRYLDFEALDASGKKTVFGSFFDNKYVLLDFSTPTCGNSMNSRPMLQQLEKELAGRLTLVTYYTESNKEHFDYFSNAENSGWAHLWNTDGGFNQTILRYRVGGTPTYFLFDKNGKILDTWMGYNEQTLERIKTLLDPS